MTTKLQLTGKTITSFLFCYFLILQIISLMYYPIAKSEQGHFTLALYTLWRQLETGCLTAFKAFVNYETEQNSKFPSPAVRHHPRPVWGVKGYAPGGPPCPFNPPGGPWGPLAMRPFASLESLAKSGLY